MSKEKIQPTTTHEKKPNRNTLTHLKITPQTN